MSLLRAASKYLFWGADTLVTSPKGPRLLIYHQVGAGTGRQMDLPLDDFVSQLGWLAEHREVVSLDSAVDRWDEEGSSRLVVLTFDDGYEDTYTTVFPMLEERNWPFTLYVATDMVERGSAPDAKGDPLGWDQIEEMSASGLMTLGGHTHTHRDMRDASPAQVQEELETSDRLLEERTGVAPRHFAYPWGYWSETADRIVRPRYRTAVLGASAGGRLPFDPHRIHRYPIQASDGQQFFRARLEGGLVFEEKVRRRLRGYEGP